MCDECGCEEINRKITESNDKIAHEIWHRLYEQKVKCINIMGAPGSGKTTVIEGLHSYLENIAVIQGDLESDIDKKRLQKLHIPTVQINTHSGCHLEARMIQKALHLVDLKNVRYLLIENVGNLVCPANVKLGQHLNIVVSSTTEGSDKPSKYPHIFRDAQVIVVSKTDLGEAVGFDENQYLSHLRGINPKARILKTDKQKTSFKSLARYIGDIDVDHSH